MSEMTALAPALALVLALEDEGTGWDSGETERRRNLRCAAQREDEARREYEIK